MSSKHLIMLTIKSKCASVDKFYIFILLCFLFAVLFIFSCDLIMGLLCECPETLYAVNDQTQPKAKNYGLKVLDRNLDFDMNANDVIVFLHIQKTGGTGFGKHLVKYLEHPCVCSKAIKRCNCNRPGTREGVKNIWLFSRYSTGWRCGLHADWTELNNCVPERMDKLEGMQKERRLVFLKLINE